MRCINLIEKNELQFVTEKFRILVADANIQSGCITQAISILEKKIDEQDIVCLDQESSDNDFHLSGFGSSNQSYSINDLVDDLLQD